MWHTFSRNKGNYETVKKHNRITGPTKFEHGFYGFEGWLLCPEDWRECYQSSVLSLKKQHSIIKVQNNLIQGKFILFCFYGFGYAEIY